MPHSTVARNTTIDGHQVDVASLETIDFGRLVAKEPAEVEKLLNASQMPGFFYLNLQNEPTGEILAGLLDVYAIAEKYFDEPSEVKLKDYKAGQDSGWVNKQQIRDFLGQMLTYITKQ
jgi:isopenicillin N synthase-like dioxygenase